MSAAFAQSLWWKEAEMDQPAGSRTSNIARLDLFFISALILFSELASIRWFPAHVLFLTFFTNTVLLACFLGISAGCLAASRPRNYIFATPALLVVALGAAQAVDFFQARLQRMISVGNQVSPQQVYFGTEYFATNLGHFVIPIEVIEAFFFLAIALSLAGPGQEMGRIFRQVPDRVEAYSLNIAGSLFGVLAFAECSWYELSPLWWFLPIVLGLAYFLRKRSAPGRMGTWSLQAPALGVVLLLAHLTTTGILQRGPGRVLEFWSPYYRIDFGYDLGWLDVNLIGHQSLISRFGYGSPAYAYSLPYLLNRDSGGPPFRDILVIGAGTGNDVSRALGWGAERVDAVEIDPVILGLGRQFHPDAPYKDPAVHLHLDDGRNYLRASRRKYDLIVYALVDSLILHSSYSNIRLESFLFTREAFADVRRHLKPGGWFVVYNYFRQGWIVCRLYKTMQQTFGSDPVVLTLPSRTLVEPETPGGLTMFVEGANGRLRAAFDKAPVYSLPDGQAPGPGTPNGFVEGRLQQGGSQWTQFRAAKVKNYQDIKVPTDNWPFLYLDHPMIPQLSWKGMLIMGSLALFVLFFFYPRQTSMRGLVRLDPRMFFLGAGFMLIEAKAVVRMALLFGSTWMTNTFVFTAVLIMILLANLYVSKRRPPRLRFHYAALFVALGLNILAPADFFLGMSRAVQVVGSCLLVFSPVLFAGVIFAVTFDASANPDLDFGTNIAGAIFGGLAEYSSMLLGFRLMEIVAVLFYIFSAIFYRPSAAPLPSPVPNPSLNSAETSPPR